MKYLIKNYFFLCIQLINLIFIICFLFINNYYNIVGLVDKDYISVLLFLYFLFPIISILLWIIWLLLNKKKEDSKTKHINFYSPFILIFGFLGIYNFCLYHDTFFSGFNLSFIFTDFISFISIFGLIGLPFLLPILIITLMFKKIYLYPVNKYVVNTIMVILLFVCYVWDVFLFLLTGLRW